MRPTETLKRMDCGMCICDVQDAVFPLVWTNPEFARITGYSPDELAGRDPWFLHTGLCPEAEEMMKAIVASGQSCRGIIQIRRSDGKKVWVEVTGHPARMNGDLRLVGLINAWTTEWQQRFAKLSPTQERMFSLLANGIHVPQAAAIMRLALSSAYRHKNEILDRLGMEDDLVGLYLLQRY